jgi:cysteine desulfurase / selenocysteine lyase
MDDVRAQMVGLYEQKVHGKKLIYFDSAATTHVPKCVTDVVVEAMTVKHGNVRRSVHSGGYRATQLYEESRKQMADFIGCDPSEFVFTSGTTHGLNILAHCVGEQLGEGDVVVLSVMGHHAHLVPWQMMAQHKGFLIKIVEVDETGKISLSHLEEILKAGGVRIVGFPFVSNVLGSIQPVADIVAVAKERYGARVVVDAAQAMGHLDVDIHTLGIDALAFGGHKMYGPAGIGGLFVTSDWLHTWKPYMTGGGMIKNVSFEQSDFLSAPHRFEAGTPNVSGAAGMAEASRWLEGVGWTEIQKREEELRNFLCEELKHRRYMKLLCSEPDIPLFSFSIARIHAHDIGTMLDFEGIATRSGHHCTMPLHQKRNIEASTRISLSFLNSMDECRVFLDALDNTVRYFGEEI